MRNTHANWENAVAKQIHKKKVNELRRECTRRRRKIKAQAEENERLAQSIDALQKAVQSRKDIVSIRSQRRERDCPQYGSVA